MPCLDDIAKVYHDDIDMDRLPCQLDLIWIMLTGRDVACFTEIHKAVKELSTGQKRSDEGHLPYSQPRNQCQGRAFVFIGQAFEDMASLYHGAYTVQQPKHFTPIQRKVQEYQFDRYRKFVC